MGFKASPGSAANGPGIFWDLATHSAPGTWQVMPPPPPNSAARAASGNANANPQAAPQAAAAVTGANMQNNKSLLGA